MSRRLMTRLVLAAMVCGVAGVAAGSEAAENSGYQWATSVTKTDGGTITARVWVPPAAERIRGVLMGERTYIANDPAIRRAAAAESLAIILLEPHFDALFRYWENDSPADLQATLDAAAAASGYREIAVAPLFPFGHSVSSVYSSHVAYWNADRVFGLLAFKGALVEPPYAGASVAGVPVLVITGKFEEFGPGPNGVLRDFEDRETGWRVSRDRYLRMRERDERNLICFAVDVGSTHMAWSDRNGELTALFLRKAAALRIPDWPVDASEPVSCMEVDVTQGVLSSTAIQDPRLVRHAPYSKFRGPRTWTWWHADTELAEAWVRFHEGGFGRRTQYVTFKDPASGRLLRSRHDMRFDLNPHWIGADTFQVAGDFLLEVRDRYAPPEPPLGHAEGEIRFGIHRTSDFVQIGPDTFRMVRYGERRAEGHILAWHPGDDVFRHAEQPALLRIPLLTRGQEQTITFPPIGPVTVGQGPVPLRATSDSGLPVTYTVDHGPARIVDGHLVLQPLPRRATLPMKIQITAWQWGSAVEPHVQTAAPVPQRVQIQGE